MAKKHELAPAPDGALARRDSMSLDELARRANAAAREAESSALYHACRAGIYLVAARAKVEKAGEGWYDWLAENWHHSRQHADRCIVLADACSLDPEQVKQLEARSIRGALAHLGKPVDGGRKSETRDRKSPGNNNRDRSRVSGAEGVTDAEFTVRPTDRPSDRPVDIAGPATPPKDPEAADRAARWNAEHAPGAPVRCWPFARPGAHEDTRTRSEAWVLCGRAVVQVVGRTGCVDLDHVDPLPEEAPPAAPPTGLPDAATLAAAVQEELDHLLPGHEVVLATVPPPPATTTPPPGAGPQLPAVVPPALPSSDDDDAPDPNDDQGDAELDQLLDDDDAELEAERAAAEAAALDAEPDPLEDARARLRADPLDLESIETLVYERSALGALRRDGLGKAGAGHEQHALLMLDRVHAQIAFKLEAKQFPTNELRRLMRLAEQRLSDAIVVVKEACVRAAELRAQVEQKAAAGVAS